MILSRYIFICIVLGFLVNLAGRSSKTTLRLCLSELNTQYKNTYFLSSFAAMRSGYPEGVSGRRRGEGTISGKGTSGTVFLYASYYQDIKDKEETLSIS